MTTHPHLQFDELPSLRSPILILAWGGWNDAGEAASHAARYLAATLKATPFAHIDPEEYCDFTEFRPLARYRGDEREIVWPATDFSHTGGAELPRAFVIGLGVEPHYRWKSYLAALMEVVRTLEIGLVLTLGAVAAPVPHTRPVRVRGSANQPDLADRYDMHPSRFEGPTGIVGVAHDLFRRENVPAISLWANVPHYVPGIANPLGASALLQQVARLTDLTIDIEPLKREGERFQQQVERAVRQDDNLAAYVRQLEEAAEASAEPPQPPPELPSAESLIADLEQFLRSARDDQPS